MLSTMQVKIRLCCLYAFFQLIKIIMANQIPMLMKQATHSIHFCSIWKNSHGICTNLYCKFQQQPQQMVYCRCLSQYILSCKSCLVVNFTKLLRKLTYAGLICQSVLCTSKRYVIFSRGHWQNLALQNFQDRVAGNSKKIA